MLVGCWLANWLVGRLNRGGRMHTQQAEMLRCVALQGRRWEELQPFFEQLWVMTFRYAQLGEGWLVGWQGYPTGLGNHLTACVGSTCMPQLH